jgi:perosamine synthetase
MWGYRPNDLPISNMAFQRILSLPLYSKMTEADIDRVIDTVRNLVKENRR